MVVTHALSLNINRRAAFAIRSDGVRNLIGRRTESDRTADGIRSGGVRSTMTKRNNRSNKSSGGLRPPQHQVEHKLYIDIIGCCGGRRPPLLLLVALLRAAEAGDLRYFCWSHFYVLRRPETSATNILLKNIFKREVREYRCRLTQHTDELLC